MKVSASECVPAGVVVELVAGEDVPGNSGSKKAVLMALKKLSSSLLITPDFQTTLAVALYHFSFLRQVLSI